MLLALLGSFITPRNYTDKAAPQVQSLFLPASAPVRSLASRLHRVLGNDAVRAKRHVDDIRLENDALQNEVAYLRIQLERERERIAAWRKLGTLAEVCVPVGVVGGDPGTRESLLVQGGMPHNVRAGMYVIYPGGVVGRLERAGAAGGQIRLVTDRGFRVRAGFAGIRQAAGGKRDAVPIATPTVLIEGTGNNMLRVAHGLTMADANAAKIQPGDWVVVNDRDWPPILDGQRIAEVIKVGPNPGAPLFAEVVLQPSTNLMLLDEVMVVVK